MWRKKVYQILEDQNLMTLKDQTLNEVVFPLKVQTLIIELQSLVTAQIVKDKGVSGSYIVPKANKCCQNAIFLERVNYGFVLQGSRNGDLTS